MSGATLWPVLVRLIGSDRVPPRLQHEAVDFGQAVERLLRERPSGPEPSVLSVSEVEDRIRALGRERGPGSRGRKERLLADLFAQLTPLEAKYVAKNLIREMRTGAAEGVVLDALALLAGGDRRAVERAHQSLGDVAEVAARVQVLRPNPPPARSSASRSSPARLPASRASRGPRPPRSRSATGRGKSRPRAEATERAPVPGSPEARPKRLRERTSRRRRPTTSHRLCGPSTASGGRGRGRSGRPAREPIGTAKRESGSPARRQPGESRGAPSS